MSMRNYIHNELKHEMTRLTDDEVTKLKALGYYSISRAHCILARIDRLDWRKHMLEILGRCDLGADHYRRVVSKDHITVHPDDHALFETSPHYGEYILKEGEKECCSLCGQRIVK